MMRWTWLGCVLALPTLATAEPLLVVVNKSADAVTLHTLTTGTERSRLPVGEGPHEVAVSPDGRHAVISLYGRATPGNALVVLDLHRGAVARRIDLSPHGRPHGLHFLADGRLLVTAEASGHLLVVDVAAGRIERAIATGQEVSHMVAASPRGTHAYVANIGSGSLTVVDIAAGRVVRHVATGAGAEGVAVTPDGREIWVSNRAADTVSIVDARTFAVVATLPCPGFPIRVAMTPDGRRAIVTSAKSGELVVFEVATRKEARRVRLLDPQAGFRSMLGSGAMPVGVALAPDGRVLVALTGADRIAVVDPAFTSVSAFWPTGDEPDGMGVWLPAPP